MTNATTDGPPWKNRGAKVFYDHDEVIAWIAALRARNGSNVVPMSSPPVRKPGKGRPTKTEQIARRNRAA